jgi:hypothetical protein
LLLKLFPIARALPQAQHNWLHTSYPRYSSQSKLA